MASISDTRAAIKSALEGMELRAYDYAPNDLRPPCAIVGFPSRYIPNDTFSDTASFTIPVTVYVSYASNRAAEDNLEAYLSSSGAGSVIAAIDGIGSSYGVAQVRDFGVLENASGQPVALGCVVDVEVFA